MRPQSSLGVSPNTLRSWERRFGYPKPRRTQGGHRQYDLAELESLRRALLETHNISSAIELARQRGEGPSSPSRLLDAWDHFDEGVADRVMEESLAVRSVERSVEEVLLPGARAGQRPRQPRGRARARVPLGHRLAVRLAPRGRAGQPPAGRAAVRLEPAPRPRVAARAGARAGPAPRRLPHPAAGLRPAARARGARDPRARPDGIRVLRRRGHPRGVGRLVYTVRQVGSAAPVFEYREAMPVTGDHGIPSLGTRRSRRSSGSRATSTAAGSSRSRWYPRCRRGTARRVAVANARRAG